VEKYTEKSGCMNTTLGRVAWYKYFRKLIGSIYAHPRSLGQEDPLEKGLAVELHGQRSLVGYSPTGPQRVGYD